jgi:hypothetical protein
MSGDADRALIVLISTGKKITPLLTSLGMAGGPEDIRMSQRLILPSLGPTMNTALFSEMSTEVDTEENLQTTFVVFISFVK